MPRPAQPTPGSGPPDSVQCVAPNPGRRISEQLNAKLARMDSFRAKVAGDAQRCRELLAKLK